jgi:hypothetical protein
MQASTGKGDRPQPAAGAQQPGEAPLLGACAGAARVQRGWGFEPRLPQQLAQQLDGLAGWGQGGVRPSAWAQTHAGRAAATFGGCVGTPPCPPGQAPSRQDCYAAAAQHRLLRWGASAGPFCGLLASQANESPLRAWCGGWCSCVAAVCWPTEGLQGRPAPSARVGCAPLPQAAAAP